MAEEGADDTPSAEPVEKPGDILVEDSPVEPAVEPEVNEEGADNAGDQGPPEEGIQDQEAAIEQPEAGGEAPVDQAPAAEEVSAAEEAPGAEEVPAAAAPQAEEQETPTADHEPAVVEEQGILPAGQGEPAQDAGVLIEQGGHELEDGMVIDGEQLPATEVQDPQHYETGGDGARYEEPQGEERVYLEEGALAREEEDFGVLQHEGGDAPVPEGGEEAVYPGSENLGAYDEYDMGDQGYDAYGQPTGGMDAAGAYGADAAAAGGHYQEQGGVPRDHDAEARALAEQMIAEEREKHEQQLKVEANARAELEDMILRIEKHFKAEQAARKKAEELLQDSIAAEMEAKNKVEDILNKRSQEQRLLEEERAAIKRERMALESMRQEFEGELQAARAEVGKAQEALASSEERIKATEQLERARLEADYQARLAAMQQEMDLVREDLQYKTMVLTQEMEKWKQQAALTANTVLEAKDDVLERKKELDHTKEKMDKLLEKLYIGRERGIELSGAIASNQRMLNMMQGPMFAGGNHNQNKMHNMMMMQQAVQQGAPMHAWGPPSPNSPKLPPLAKQQLVAQGQGAQQQMMPQQSHLMYDNAAIGGMMGGFVGVPGVMGNMGSFAGAVASPHHAGGIGSPHHASGGMHSPYGGAPHGVSASADFPHGFGAAADYSGNDSPAPRPGSLRRVHSGGHLPAIGSAHHDGNQQQYGISASHSDDHLSPDGAPTMKSTGPAQYAHVQSKFARDAAEKAMQNKAKSRSKSGRIGKGKPDRFAEADRENARVAGAMTRWN